MDCLRKILVGMLIVTLPWHLVGVMGQPRRMAYFDFTDPAQAPQAIWVSLSTFGGFVLVLSAILLVGVLAASHRGPNAAVPPLKFSLAINPPRRLFSISEAPTGVAYWMGS